MCIVCQVVLYYQLVLEGLLVVCHILYSRSAGIFEIILLGGNNSFKVVL